MKIWLVVKYYLINISFKFHRDPSVHCGDMAKICSAGGILFQNKLSPQCNVTSVQMRKHISNIFLIGEHQLITGKKIKMRIHICLLPFLFISTEFKDLDVPS